MFRKRSRGSKLGGAAGAVIAAAFFLPWVRACGTEMTGYEIATNQHGNVEDPAVYWLTLAAGIFCMALFLLVKTSTARARLMAGIARLAAGLVGFLPLVNIWANVQQRGDSIEILQGAWIVVAGYVGVFLSFFVDLFGAADEPP